MLGMFPRVVIVGSGFGGLAAAKKLVDSPAQVTIIDKQNHHTFQPLLYQVATAGLDVDDVCYATRGIFKNASNVQVRHGEVSRIDTERKAVYINEGETAISYDHLILACGAVTADFGVPGVAEHAFGLKTAADAVKLRSHVLSNFEKAEHSKSPGELLTILVAGGGPTGVEVAGGMIELIDHVLKSDFSRVDFAKARVVLVEAGPRLLSTMNRKLSVKAFQQLQKMGVEVLYNTAVEKVTPDSVTLSDGSVIQSNTMVWAAGVKANPIGQTLGVETVAGGRVVVNGSLSIPEDPNVFVIGDLAAVQMPDGTLVPQVATGAIQMGRYVGERLLDIFANENPAEPVAFSYKDKGSMATIGRNSGLTELPNGLRLSGWFGWVAWLGLHLVMLMGFRNRANVFINWAWNYLTYDRGSRIIVEE